jgi:hypothetical protein
VQRQPLPEPFDNVGGGNTTLFIDITDLDRKQKGAFIANISGMILPSATVGLDQAHKPNRLPKAPRLDSKPLAGPAFSISTATLKWFKDSAGGGQRTDVWWQF